MMQPCASAAKLRSGGPILFLGITAMAQTGTRHLESSSATRHKRTDWAETVGCLQQARTSRHKAIKSLRAKATIMGLRVPRAFSVRARNHCAKALFF